MAKAMEMEILPKELVQYTENLSWLQKYDSLPIISSAEFNSHIQSVTHQWLQLKKRLIHSGFILDFGDIIVTKPQWLSDIFTQIVSVKNEIKNGILTLNELHNRLSQFDKEIRDYLIKLMIHEFKVCTTHPTDRNALIFPFLLPKQEPLKIYTKWESCWEKKYGFIGRSYKVPFITYGFFEKLFVLMGEQISGA